MAILAPPPGTRMSPREFADLREGPPFFDYVNGEAIEVNRPTARHQRIGRRLTTAIEDFVELPGLGMAANEIDVELPHGDVFGPDVVYLSAENAGRYDEAKGDVYGAPDLVVEVLSPSTEMYDRTVKLPSYARAGVPWVWLVNQETLVVEEYRWTPEGYLLASTTSPDRPFRPGLFPTLELNLATLAASVSPSPVE